MNHRAVREIEDVQPLFDTVEIERHVNERRHGFSASDFINKFEKFSRSIVNDIDVDFFRLESAVSQNGAQIAGNTGRLGVADNFSFFQIFHLPDFRQRYQTIKLGAKGYLDIFDDFLDFLAPRLEEAYRLLKPCGSLYFHIDYREVHYCKVLLDQVFGREGFLNEIIWAYDYGARTRRKWPPKHDTILWYAKDPACYTFNYDSLERIPYMAPTLVGPEKAARGKTLTDTWWHTIVPTNGKEKTGYPTQKPLAIIRRIVMASSNPGEVVLDFFAGSGTVGESCLALGRQFILIDHNPEALDVMARRFSNVPDIEWVGYQPRL